MEEIQNTIAGDKLACTGCGAYLTYKPGTQHLNCVYCGAENEILIAEGQAVEELDFLSFLTESAAKSETLTEQFVLCGSCKATSTLSANLSSAQCPYCSSPLIISEVFQEAIISPGALLPFKLDIPQAKTAFDNWIKKLWFAPNELKKLAAGINHFQGVYIPYWTYDTFTVTHYTGERGEHYYVNETYTTTENGKSVTKTRRVQKTRWYSARGTVAVAFDDLLVTATKSLPKKQIEKLEPWDMENLVPFDKSYLSGYVTEKYQVDLKEGFEIAKTMSENKIDRAIRNDIGGDEQRVNTTQTNYSDITFKHLLFPVYVNVYKYNNKVYQFLINARTGEVQGQRPYSWIKITLFVLAIIAIIALVVFFAKYQGQQAAFS